MKKILILLLTLCLWLPARSQQMVSGNTIPQGALVYSLPRTCVRIVAEAQCVQFTAGPYAKYARKYLGIEAPQENKTTYELSRMEVTPLLEADPGQMYVVNLSKNMEPWFLQLTSQGLVMLADTYAGKEQNWRFPSQALSKELSDAGIIENLKQERTTLYRSQVQGQTVSQVPVQQNQLVEKTLEQRADEAARKIFEMRSKRTDIITGNTDATFSGEALGAAVEEMRRMEEEYLQLFIGTTTVGTRFLSVDVVPEEGRNKYVAFRVSDTEGLLPASNINGRPIVLDLSIIAQDKSPELLTADASRSAARLYYRYPAVMQLRLMDGQLELLQSRISIYQFGKILTFSIY